MLIRAIGHSTRPIDEFIAILKAHSVERLVDIRTIPKSRHNPQFAREALQASLNAAGLRYEYLAGLGGLRRPLAGSVNTGWRNASFRGYADYMQTPAFTESLEILIDLASRLQTGMMCAEAVPWRCHRSLVADSLVIRNIRVDHIDSATRSHAHKLTPFARVSGTDIIYPEET